MGKKQTGGVYDASQNPETVGRYLGRIWLPRSGLRVFRGGSRDGGAEGRQKGQGRQAGRDVERKVSRPPYQSHIYSARGNGRETRPGDRLRRRSRSDGNGPHLRPAIRKGGTARRP